MIEMVLRTVKIIKPVIEVEVIICSQMCCTFNYNTQKINVTNIFFIVIELNTGHNKIRYSLGIFQSVSADHSQPTEGW